MDVVSSIKACSHASKVVQPAECAFGNPTIDSQAAAMFRIPFRQVRFDAAIAECFSMFFGVVRPIRIHLLRALLGPARFSRHRLDPVHQRDQLGHVVSIRAGEDEVERDAVGIGDDMVLAAGFSPIRWVGTRLSAAPYSTNRGAVKTAARDQSSRSASRKCSNSVCVNASQTPASCHSCNRRQQVIPDPQPISMGRYSHGMPVRSTKMMPVKALRSSIRGRPPLGLGSCSGSKGETISHNSFGTNSLAIVGPPRIRIDAKGILGINDRKSRLKIKPLQRNLWVNSLSGRAPRLWYKAIS